MALAHPPHHFFKRTVETPTKQFQFHFPGNVFRLNCLRIQLFCKSITNEHDYKEDHIPLQSHVSRRKGL